MGETEEAAGAAMATEAKDPTITEAEKRILESGVWRKKLDVDEAEEQVRKEKSMWDLQATCSATAEPDLWDCDVR